MRVKILFSYSWKLLASSLVETLYQNIRSLIIGKLYTPDVLGVYNRGWQFPTMISANIDGPIQSVMLPALSKVQDEPERAKAITRRSIAVSSYVVFPIMLGLAACAEPLVTLILTEKWISCVPFLQIGCFVFLLNPVHMANLQAISAMGRSDIYLKLEIAKKIFAFFVILITASISVYAIALGGLVCSIFSAIVNAYPNKKLLNYGYIEQMTDLLPNLLMSIAMMALVLLIGKLKLSSLQLLPLQILAGVLFYLGASVVTKSKSLSYLISFFHKRSEKKCC